MSPEGHGYENWLFTSNNTDEEPGVRLTLDVDEWEMQSGATVSDVPCHDTSDSPEYIAWAPDGKSIGIARDELIASNPYIWAGVSADHSSASCPSADFTDDCIGGSFYDLTSESVSQQINPNFEQSPSQPVDIIARYPKVAIASKGTDEIVGWNAATGAELMVYDEALEVTQLEWVTDPFFVATVPQKEDCFTWATSDERMGEVWLARLKDASNPEPWIYEVDPGDSSLGTKPEGIALAPLSDFDSNSCRTTGSYTPEYVLWVGDYCNSELHVFTLDLSNREFKHEMRVDLNEDSDGNAAGTDCAPSSVSYNVENQMVYVLCQTGQTIMRVNTETTPCNPTWYEANGDQADLEYIQSGDPATCGSAWDHTEQDFCKDSATSCSPHDIATDGYSNPGWLFTALTGKGQILAINETDLENQAVIYNGGSTSFAPHELDLLPSENPND
jgi:hypothetical protein